MDPRLELVNRMDQAAASADVVRLVALGRLNWRLVDQQVLAMTAQRVAVLQQQQHASNQQMQVDRARQQLEDSRFNYSIGSAAVAIGDDPSKYMVNSSSGGGGGAAAQDPRIQIYASVHQMLLQTASLRGAPDPQVSPGIATRASDILNGRIDLKDAIKLAVDALPSEQRTMVKVLAAVPFMGKAILGPIVRASAAGAVSLDELYRLVPDALLPGQPPPVQAQPAAPPVATAPSVMSALFTNAMSTNGENTDAAFIAAIDAAEKTSTIDDDIVVLQQLSRASGNLAPSEPVVRRAEALVSSMAQRTERRDEVAQLLAWVARVIIARGLTGELSQRVLKSAQAVLQRPLGDDAAVTLTAATCEVFVAIGKSDKALALVDVIAKGVRQPYQQQLAAIRSAVANPKPAPAAPARGGLVPADVRAALGGSLVWEDWRGDFAAAQRLVDARPDPVARALVLALRGRAAAAMREVQPLAQQNDVAALHVFRYAQRLNAAFLPGGDAGPDVYMRYITKGLVFEIPRGPVSEDERIDRTTLAEMLEVLPVRSTTSDRGRRDDARLRELLGTTMQESFDDRATLAERARRSPAWVGLAAADLHHRDGNRQRAGAMLEIARTASAGDDHAIGEIALVEGHWAACALESPLTLGLCLEGSDNLESEIDARVERRERADIPPQALAAANEAYERASRAFTGSPRGLAVATLARAGLAALANDHTSAQRLAVEAELALANVGDDFGRFLARTHVAIASTATGAPFDRALIREIGTWGSTDGSLSFTIGCARLLSRSGRRALLRDGDVERALALHGLACELLGATPLDMLTAQAHTDSGTALQLANELDGAADQFERASTRLTLATLGAVEDLLPRRAKTLFKVWQLHDQRANAEGIERTAAAITMLLPDLEQLAGAAPMSDAMLTLMLLTRTVGMSPARIAIYRARDVANDPASSEIDRTVAWRQAADAARAAPAGEREQFEGLVEIGRGDFAAASQAFERRFVKTTFAPNPLAEQQARQQDALELTCFLLAKNHARARTAYDRLVARDPDWISHSESPWVPLGDVAALFEAEGNLDEAAQTYDHALAIVEARRGRLTQDALKRSFVDTSPIHAMYVGAARVASDPARAFELVERGRARALLDLTWDRGHGAGARRSYDARYGLLQELLAVERNKTEPSAERIEELRMQLAQLEASPSPAGRVAPIVPLDDVTRELAPGQLVLQYAFADDILIAWAITRSGMVTRHRVPIQGTELRRNALAFRAACDRGADPRSTGDYLGKLLLDPFADAIRAAQHVVVIPTDALHVVPFHALPFGDGLLVDAAATSYAPSVSVARLLGRGPIERGMLLAVGDPANMRDGNDPLRPLPGAAVEAKRIAAALNSDLPPLLGADATARAVREVIQTARYVHLGTHGLLSSQSPWLSTIALANGESLDLATLGALELQAELVTLSACNTARGSVGKSDEVLGFARALVAAGARRVLVSLWPVSDVATCELMTVFYRELANGAAAPHALRTAQQAVRTLDAAAVAKITAELAASGATRVRRDLAGKRDPDAVTFAHPTFWAPFVLVGG
jgi:CHAT domain-containing protein